MIEGTAVVAGNGGSVQRLKSGQVLASDFIIRTNNFFFEPSFYLGPRVDLAFMGGDPRVAPFVFETLYQRGRDYRVRAWSSHNPKVVRAGRRFAPLFVPYMCGKGSVAAHVKTLIARYQRHPMTGTYAALMAYGLGARDIVLVGMDFYSGARRYSFDPGPHYRALMGEDVNMRGVDRDLHCRDLDVRILEHLATQDGVHVTQACSSAHLAGVLDQAPCRQGAALAVRPRLAPPDWEPFAGFYPIHVLRALRRTRRVLRAVWG